MLNLRTKRLAEILEELSSINYFLKIEISFLNEIYCTNLRLALNELESAFNSIKTAIKILEQ